LVAKKHHVLTAIKPDIIGVFAPMEHYTSINPKTSLGKESSEDSVVEEI
jgi:hypothetical protein